MLIRYYLDEHIFADAAVALRTRGIDALTTLEAGHVGFSDEQQLAFAASEERIMVTRDRDFVTLHHQGIQHAGIARWGRKHASHSYLITKLIALWRTQTAEEMRGRIEYY